MNCISKLILAVTIIAGPGVQALAAEFPMQATAINDELDARVAVRIDAQSRVLGTKVTGMIEAILQQRRTRLAPVALMQPDYLVVVPIRASDRFAHKLKNELIVL